MTIWKVFVVFAFVSSSASVASVAATPPRVLVAEYSGAIGPAAAEYLPDAVDAAEKGSFDAVVIKLDTPGGLDASMRVIVKAILSSRVPVIVYVAPSGARAASAGVFITMAASVAAMAPGTNIGAAHPVELGATLGIPKEKISDVMETKIANDASAYLRSIAAQRGRNAQWASLVVFQSTSVTAAEAVKEGVVDLEAPSLPDLLNKIDGRKISDFARPLRTKAAELSLFPMTWREHWLASISDPNIAMTLMTVGVSGVLIELYSPGLILPGIVGAASLILAFYSFQTLSSSFAGLLMVLLGVILFLLELKFHSFGLLALSGAGCLFFGSVMLFQNSGLGVPWPPIIGALAALGAVFSVLFYITRQAMGRRSKTGSEGLIHSEGLAMTALNPTGQVQLGSEIWQAESLEGDIAAGSRVVVIQSEGLILKVKKKIRRISSA